MDILLPWQQKHALITLLFEGIKTSYLLHRFLEATAISSISCFYGYLVTMTTKQVLITLLFEGIRISYLVHTFLEATTVSGITCCYGYFVILATETCAYNIVVWRYTNFIFRANVSWGFRNLLYF